MKPSKVFIASDHRGFPLKQMLIASHLEATCQVVDLGTDTDSVRCDGFDYAVKLAEAMRKEPESFGILICGTGQATAMAANRFRHIRAALCTDVTMARLTRQHNDANVLVLGAHIIGQEVAQDCVTVFLTTDFLGGRYAPRRDKLTDLGGL